MYRDTKVFSVLTKTIASIIGVYHPVRPPCLPNRARWLRTTLCRTFVI